MKEHIGIVIRDFRNISDKSLEDLAYETGLSCSGINNIEKGKNKPSMRTLEKIAKALKTTASNLMRQMENKK